MRSRVIDRFSMESSDVRGAKQLAEALTAALEIRDEAFPNDHDIDALHPARTVLILMDDARVTDPVQLSAGALLESRDNALAVPEARVDAIDFGAAAILRAIPTPLTSNPDDLLEALLALPPEFLTIALAERLDHARHLHLRPPAVWQDSLEVETRTYLPLALRAGGLLGKRYERWHSATLDRLRKRG